MTRTFEKLRYALRSGKISASDLIIEAIAGAIAVVIVSQIFSYFAPDFSPGWIFVFFFGYFQWLTGRAGA